jgi:hypothetical protein
MKLPDAFDQFLVAAYVIAEGDEDRRIITRAVLDRVDFPGQPRGWTSAAIRELSGLGFLVDYTRDGTAEDQFVQVTSAGARRAKALMKGGLQLRWLTPWEGGVTFSDGSQFVTEMSASDAFTMVTAQGPISDDQRLPLDHTSPLYEQVNEGFAEAIARAQQDNEIEDRDQTLLSLRYAQSLWQRSEITYLQFRVGVVMAIDDACQTARDSYSAIFMQALLALLLRFAKDAWGITLPN